MELDVMNQSSVLRLVCHSGNLSSHHIDDSVDCWHSQLSLISLLNAMYLEQIITQAQQFVSDTSQLHHGTKVYAISHIPKIPQGVKLP